MADAQISEVDAVAAPFSPAQQHVTIGKRQWVRQEPYVSTFISPTIFS
jgi:hypothetical protein